MAKRKKHKWTLEEFLDSARDHIGNILDNMGVRDIIYVLCWISGTILIYNSVSGVKKILLRLPKGLEREGEIFWRTGILGGAAEIPLGAAEEYKYKEAEIAKSLDEVDWNIFMLSMIGAYALLQINIADVQSAIKTLQAAIVKQASAIG